MTINIANTKDFIVLQNLLATYNTHVSNSTPNVSNICNRYVQLHPIVPTSTINSNINSIPITPIPNANNDRNPINQCKQFLDQINQLNHVNQIHAINPNAVTTLYNLRPIQMNRNPIMVQSFPSTPVTPATLVGQRYARTATNQNQPFHILKAEQKNKNIKIPKCKNNPFCMALRDRMNKNKNKNKPAKHTKNQLISLTDINYQIKHKKQKRANNSNIGSNVQQLLNDIMSNNNHYTPITVTPIPTNNRNPFVCNSALPSANANNTPVTHCTVSAVTPRTQSHGSDNIKPYKCKYCAERFGLRKEMIQHESIHMSSKPYQCRICAKQFINQTCLRSHMSKKHTPQTPQIKTEKL